MDLKKPIEDVNAYLLCLVRECPSAILDQSTEVAEESPAEPPLEATPTDGPADPQSVALHLNSVLDCEKLASKCMHVFSKRYGRAQ